VTTRQNAAVKRPDDGQKLIWTFIADEMSGHNAAAFARGVASKLGKTKAKPS